MTPATGQPWLLFQALPGTRLQGTCLWKWYRKVQHAALFLAIAVNETWKETMGVWSFPKYCHLSKRFSSSLDSAHYGYGPVQCATNGMHWPYWVYMAAQTKPARHEGCKEDEYSSVVISEWIFPLKQFCLCEADFSFFQRGSVETGLEDCLHQKFEVQWHFLTLISFPCWWQRKATLNYYHASSCFHKTLELSAQNSIKPVQQQSRVQYVILNSS